ncbi:hypothetical protein BVG79_02458 [Ketogulonicigenium robustum]|uniref:Uncharacterized protein n=1 Tax=Ketogulonicigenium robustum TaxID=92947 RepID=A0A1W6P2Q1_9RHOB|nr:hypothetical protein [Ketogulonicigenium robustum]ARO15798.1 hypothetical protein BVG79_02458 [Ketogulonicigenium robustum]
MGGLLMERRFLLVLINLPPKASRQLLAITGELRKRRRKAKQTGAQP